MTPGTVVYLIGEWINIEAGTAILGVPYKGSANALVDVLAGRVDATIDTGTASFGHIRSGKLRALAVSSPARHRGVPMPSSPEEMRALVEREVARWKRVVELKDIERQN